MDIDGWYREYEFKCPDCGGAIVIACSDLMRQMVGGLTTPLDGQSLPGLVVYCGTCSVFLRLTALERKRNWKSEYPIKAVVGEKLEIQPRLRKQPFPYGCPGCKTSVKVDITVPDFMLGANKHREIETRVQCPACSDRWIVVWSPSGIRWIQKHSDGSRTAVLVQDCKSCGQQLAVYHWTRHSRCRACGEHEGDNHW